MQLPIIAIVGPTAVGKSEVAEAVALRFHGEIVNADSMQIYRGMDIGTAKVPKEKRCVQYHLVDIVEPGTPYSAALYQDAARSVISELHARDVVPLFVGGTGLYIRAALDDLSFPPGDTATPLRREIEAHAAQIGPEALHAELRAQDSAAADLIHPHNVRRVVRALEMNAQGVSYADQAAHFSRRVFHFPHTHIIGLTMERAELYARIDARTREMIASGLLEEVRALLSAGFHDALTAAQAIGYKEIVPVIEGGCTLEEACAAIQQATRRYAKRQLSWFRADPRISWIDVSGLSGAQRVSHICNLIELVSGLRAEDRCG